jgi:hypothetical protein
MKDTCRKTTHQGMTDRAFTVFQLWRRIFLFTTPWFKTLSFALPPSQ